MGGVGVSLLARSGVVAWRCRLIRSAAVDKWGFLCEGLWSPVTTAATVLHLTWQSNGHGSRRIMAPNTASLAQHRVREIVETQLIMQKGSSQLDLTACGLTGRLHQPVFVLFFCFCFV